MMYTSIKNSFEYIIVFIVLSSCFSHEVEDAVVYSAIGVIEELLQFAIDSGSMLFSGVRGLRKLFVDSLLLAISLSP